MTVFYNEFDPFPAAVLRSQIERGNLFPGEVDERSITDVKAADLVRFRGVHFFAGIGCFPLGLKLAGMPADFSIWTFGWPCQGNSVAGKGKGRKDPRSGLIGQVIRLLEESRELGTRPAWLLAENVPGIRNKGVDGIIGEVEGTGYTGLDPIVVGVDDVGGPHRRKRVWFVWKLADRERDGRGGILPETGCRENEPQQWPHVDREGPGVGRPGARTGELENADSLTRARQSIPVRPRESRQAAQHALGASERAAELAESRSGVRGSGSESQQPLGEGRRFRSDACRSGKAGMADAECQQRPKSASIGGYAREEFTAIAEGHWPARPGQRQHEWEAPRLAQFSVGGSVDGAPCGLLPSSVLGPFASDVPGLRAVPEEMLEAMARRANKSGLKACGNALVWLIPWLIGKWILEVESDDFQRKDAETQSRKEVDH